MTLTEQDRLQRIREIRASLDHPIVDGDGHLIESVPLLFEHVRAEGGAKAVDAFAGVLPMLFTGAGDRARNETRGPWWPMPTDHRYQATVMAPGLLAERLPELGIDFAILYPSLGLVLATIPDDAVRRGAVRALNVMNATLCGPYAERLTPAAVIPMHTPEEAVAELTFVVRDLGLKVAMIPAAVARPLEAHPEAFPAACRLDRFGLDSDHDYDPLWQAFVDLGVAVTGHGGLGFRYLPAGKASPTSYMFNHILGHAELQEGLCRSLLMGGVLARFPALRFGFLEGGVSWAVELAQNVHSHWTKRSAVGLAAYDPARLDVDALNRLLADQDLPGAPPELLRRGGEADTFVRDEFEESGIRSPADLARMFTTQVFCGCEADDRAVARSLDGAGNPLGVAYRPLLGSDIGHWDVPHLEDVIPESHELVEDGLLSDAGYRAFAFENPVRLHGGMNPAFFEGTAVAEPARQLVE
jgi:predicted TIM-barrel fold metal-dependent hydrolase